MHNIKNTQQIEQEENESYKGNSLGVKTELFFTSSHNRKPVKKAKKYINSSSKNYYLPKYQLSHPNELHPNIKVNNIKKTLCKALPKTLRTDLTLNARQNLQPPISDDLVLYHNNVQTPNSRALVLRSNKTPVCVEKKIHVLFTNTSNTDPPIIPTQDLQSFDLKPIDLPFNKTRLNVEKKSNVQNPENFNKELSSFAQENIQPSISETVVIKLNKDETSAEQIESETDVKAEQINTTSGFSEEFELFMHAIFNIACKVYPKVVHQRKGTESQEISITFRCDLKKNETDSTPTKVFESKSTQKSDDETNYQKCKTTVSKTKTDFLKHNYISSDSLLYQKECLENFVKLLSSVLSTAVDISQSSTSRVPILHFGNWHFRNIGQGYLLRFLLRRSNINTLNIMRNLYFILITTDSTNLFVDVDVTLKNDIFMLDDIRPAGDIAEVTVTEEDSECSFSTESTFKYEARTFEPDGYSSSDGTFNHDIGSHEIGSFGPDIFSNISGLIALSDDSDCGDGLSFESLPSTCTSRCTIVAGKRCAATSTIFSLLIPPTVVKQTTDQAAGDDPSVGLEKCKLKSNYWIFKPWFTKRYNVQNRNAERSFFTNNYIDETIFERMTVVEKYIHIVTCQCASPEFSKVFLKCLGHTIGCTLISFFISLL